MAVSSSRLPIPSTYQQPSPDLFSHNFTDTQLDEYKEQDRFLPIANVARIMKDSLPAGAKISKESKECLQECVSEFIMFITSEASDRCDQNKRKTIHGEDILEAMEALGFDNYVEVLKIYLAKYRMLQRDKPKRSSKASSTAGAAAAATASSSSGSKKRPRDLDDEGEEDGSQEDEEEE